MITETRSGRLDNDIHISYVQFGLVVIEIRLVVRMAKLQDMGAQANEEYI
jgi:hypothetical protein